MGCRYHDVTTCLEFITIGIYNLLRIAIVPISWLLAISNDENAVNDIKVLEGGEIGIAVIVGIDKLMVVKLVGIGFFLTRNKNYAHCSKHQ